MKRFDYTSNRRFPLTMQRARFLTGGLAVGMSLAASLWGWSSASAQPLRQVHYAIPVHAANYVPMEVARKKGFYGEERLDVKMPVIGAALSIKAALAGSIDYSGAGGSPIDAVVRGAKFKLLLVVGDKPYFDLITQPHIRTFAQMKGKVFSVSNRGDITEAALREILSKNGLQPDRDVTIMEIGPETARLAALQARSVDGSILSVPFNLRARDMGFFRMAYAGDYVRATAGGVSAPDKKIKESPDEVQRFIRATLKGLLYYRKNKQASMPIMMEFLNVKDPNFVEKVYDNHMATLTRDGTISEELMHQTLERAKRAAQVTREVKTSEAFDFSFVRKALAELEASGIKP